MEENVLISSTATDVCVLPDTQADAVRQVSVLIDTTDIPDIVLLLREAYTERYLVSHCKLSITIPS